MEFSLETILSVTTKRLLVNIDDLYKILNYLTGDNLFTHQLPRAGQECSPVLEQQISLLKKVDISILDTLLKDCNDKNEVCITWVENERQRLGLAKHYNLKPLPSGNYDHRDPINELEEMVGDKTKIICITRK